MRHKNECAACAEFAVDMRHIDRTLVEALRVDVPENLASRIILRQSLQKSEVPSKYRPRRYAIAASLLLTLGLAGGLYTIISTAPFHRAVMAHLDGEWDSLVQRQDVSDQKLMSVLDTVGGELKGDIGKIRHASLCDFSEYGGAHLVLEGRKAPSSYCCCQRNTSRDRTSCLEIGLRAFSFPPTTAAWRSSEIRTKRFTASNGKYELLWYGDCR